ncbi:hypothetical protein PG993_003344 [Apiospora rasikravindrae]|uniref:RING-type domain-containing protein n=1 Tax=Apiospora rasikravindrae TaxID=990691 RepID=A0ABR1TZ98_9PEZI
MGDPVDGNMGFLAEVIDLVDSESDDGRGTLTKIRCSRSKRLAEMHNHNAEYIVALIVDQQENGTPYPKRENIKKRKRAETNSPVVEESAAIRAKLHDPEYSRIMTTSRYKDMAVTLISQDYPKVPKNTIKNLLAQHGSAELGPCGATLGRKKTSTKLEIKYSRQNIDQLLREDASDGELAALKEFVAARRIREEHEAKAAVEAEENANTDRAIMSGQVAECGCCLDDVPLNRMVQCDGEETHSFCRPCMKKQAESQIGYQKYQLTCMSMEGCQAGFSASQRRMFLDEKLQVALDRIEQQAMLEMAGIESLETCPFCPFAMDYPPVEENKEFRCANADCEIVSCRLCRKVTHIPKTCAEAAAEEGHEARHTIEEAMSEAMIRRCNSCKNPFIKQDGCNKITCTRCRTIQCYVCRQTVKGYDHFNDATRGGKEGQCPLFDATEERHEAEVQRAQEEMRKKVAEENPDLSQTRSRKTTRSAKKETPGIKMRYEAVGISPLNFLGGHPFVLPLVNAAPLRPGQANAAGPDVQMGQAGGPRPEAQVGQENGNHHWQPRQGNLTAAQRAQQHIMKQLDNRKKGLFVRLADQAPLARAAMPQGPQPAGYQGVIAQPAPHNLPPNGEAVPVNQVDLAERARLGRVHRQPRPNENPNNDGPRAILQGQGVGREQAQARPRLFAEAQPGVQRYTEIAQRLLGNDHLAAAAAAAAVDGRPPNRFNRQRGGLPGNGDVLRGQAARREEPQDAFFLGGMGPDVLGFMPPAFAQKPEFPGMRELLEPPLIGPAAVVNRLQRGCHALLRDPEQPEQRPGRQFGSVNPARHQVAPQLGPGPASARGVQNNRA